MKSMKASSICISLLTVCLFLLATAGVFTQTGKGKAEQSPQVQPDKQTAAKGSVIGYLQTRDKIVTISRGAKGSVYTVKAKDGKVLASDLNEKDFEEKYPTLFNQVKYGLAGNDATLRKSSLQAPISPINRGTQKIDASK